MELLLGKGRVRRTEASVWWPERGILISSRKSSDVSVTTNGRSKSLGITDVGVMSSNGGMRGGHLSGPGMSWCPL